MVLSILFRGLEESRGIGCPFVVQLDFSFVQRAWGWVHMVLFVGEWFFGFSSMCLWGFYRNFNFGFGCPLVVQMDFPFVQRAWGCGSQGVFRLGMFLSIFPNVIRRFDGAVSISGVRVFFSRSRFGLSVWCKWISPLVQRA